MYMNGKNGMNGMMRLQPIGIGTIPYNYLADISGSPLFVYFASLSYQLTSSNQVFHLVVHFSTCFSYPSLLDLYPQVS